VIGFSPAIYDHCLFSSCSQCERDFFVTTMTESLQTPIDGSIVDGSSTKGGSDPIISTEIRRLRIKFRLGR